MFAHRSYFDLCLNYLEQCFNPDENGQFHEHYAEIANETFANIRVQHKLQQNNELSQRCSEWALRKV